MPEACIVDKTFDEACIAEKKVFTLLDIQNHISTKADGHLLLQHSTNGKYSEMVVFRQFKTLQFLFKFQMDRCGQLSWVTN